MNTASVVRPSQEGRVKFIRISDAGLRERRVALFELRAIVRAPLLLSSVFSLANGSSGHNGSSPDAFCLTAALSTAF